MAQNAPGKHHRKGLTVKELFRLFPDDAAAEKWFEEQRWPEVRACTDCGSTNTRAIASRKPMPYRCRDCRAYFSVRKGTVMHASKKGYQDWVIAIYMMTTGLKGTSSMKLHRELGMTYKTAWYLMQRIREGFLGEPSGGGTMTGPVEVDETYVGGKRRNMSNAKRRELKGTGRGGLGSGKTAVVGAKDRASNTVRAKVVQRTDAATLQGFIVESADAFATIYTDDSKAYASLPFDHDTVKHSDQEYVKGDTHTNGIESLWSMFKRGYVGTYHKMSPKHMHRYVAEFAGRHNIRELDTLTQMCVIARRMDGKRLRYRDLIGG